MRSKEALTGLVSGCLFTNMGFSSFIQNLISLRKFVCLKEVNISVTCSDVSQSPVVP